MTFSPQQHNAIVIESNVRIPQPKYKQRDEALRRKVFKAYANAYEALYVRKPDRYTFDEPTGMMTAYCGTSIAERAGLKRFEQLTRIMRNKLADR